MEIRGWNEGPHQVSEHWHRKKKIQKKRNSAATGEASVETQHIWELLRTKNTDSAFGEGGSFPHRQAEQMWEAGEHHHT